MHPGIWLAFGDVNGEDFWRNKARIEHVAFVTEPSLTAGRLVFATRSRLVAGNAALAMLISRFAIAPTGDHAFTLTWEAEIRGEARELVLGDQEEMGLGVRVATELTEQKGGLVANSEGVTGAKTVWGKQAAWATYSRELDGRTRGVAIFPSASNPAPTWWHSRDYGILVANGFGKRALPASPDGKLVVKSGDSLELRYDVLLFDAPSAAPIDFPAAYRRIQSSPRQFVHLCSVGRGPTIPKSDDSDVRRFRRPTSDVRHPTGTSDFVGRYVASDARLLCSFLCSVGRSPTFDVRCSMSDVKGRFDRMFCAESIDTDNPPGWTRGRPERDWPTYTRFSAVPRRRSARYVRRYPRCQSRS